MPKTALREVLESLNPFKKKKARPSTVDSDALSIGGEAVTLYRRGTAAGVSLGGALVDRRDEINDQAIAKHYDEARRLLDSYREDIEASIAVKEDAALYVDAPGMTDEEREHARMLRLSIAEDIDAMKLDEAADEVDQLSAVCARAQMREDLGLDRAADILRGEINADLPEEATPQEMKEVETLRGLALKAMDGDLTAAKIEQARKLAKPMHDAIEAIERRLEVTAADPAVLYDRLKLRVDDVVNYPPEYQSSVIRAAVRAVDEARGRVETRLDAFAKAAKGDARDKAAKSATEAVGVLRQKIAATAPSLRAHDDEVRKYFASLKRMTPQIQVADTLPEDDGSGGDTDWKAERQAYDASRQRVVKLQDGGKFREANVELANCARLMKALLDKRREAIDNDIGGAGDDDQARQVVEDLKAEGLLEILTAKQQLALVKKMPPDSDDNLDARAAVFGNPALDEDFVKAEQKVLKDVIKMLRGNDGKDATPESIKAKQEWAENEKHWAAWAGKDPKQPKAKDISRLQAVCQKIAEQQFKELMKLAGLDPDNPPPKFPQPPVTVKLKKLKPTEFGETTPRFPAEITINSEHRMIGDFKEMMDTILHENTHAWQMMVIAQFRGTAPFTAQHQAKLKGPTALTAMKVQAELFSENLKSYSTDDGPYRHQPVEEQAWTFGGKSATALLVPPPKRSFDSGKGLKNKLWVVTSMSRTSQATVRLADRHGIYVDEWEGEEAGDKKLTLEGVPGVSSTQRLQVQDVIDEYTLLVDLDASGLLGRRIPKAEVEQEMAALARKQYKKKQLSELTAEQRKAVFKAVLEKKNWEAGGDKGQQTDEVRSTDEVEVERGRLVLDESVAKLS
ncbi:hypothetical protein ACS5PN_28200 [Roseateles sp. NT4]|uniref:hypothetical protein n=1 Tax=Roseateles sp. NT4 TaxID=3453715 RepID=UPI003EF08A92